MRGTTCPLCRPTTSGKGEGTCGLNPCLCAQAAGSGTARQGASLHVIDTAAAWQQSLSRWPAW